MECLKCFKSGLFYDKDGKVICPQCGEVYKCDVKEMYDKLGIEVNCEGCGGGYRRQNFNVYHCSKTEYVIRCIEKTFRSPWNRESSIMEDELRQRPAFGKVRELRAYRLDRFKNPTKVFHVEPDRLAWPEPDIVKMIESE